MDKPKKESFEDAGSDKSRGLISEILAMLGQNKKYWLLPIILVLLVIGVLLILGGTALAPFLYPF
jgi:4-hydroxybenzoate polyprenyltransferase